MSGKTTVSALEKDLDKQLQVLKKSIMGMQGEQSEKEKKQKIITKWLKEWAAYIDFEPRFKPHLNITYKPGVIVQVNFGYNVGSEQGGRRPAVVIEDNNRTSKTVMVVPLSSLKEGTSVEDVEEKGNVYLGVLNDYNKQFGQEEGTESIAIMNQIRSISKIRISTPTKTKDNTIFLDPTHLEKIYIAIRERYAAKGIENAES